MVRIKIFLFIYSVITAIAAPAFSEWKQVLEDKNETISVYYRELETGHIEFKGVTQINTSLNSFIFLFRDVDVLPQWVDRTERVELLETVSDMEYYVYMVNNAPFPLKNRDGIVRTITVQDPETLAVTVTGTSVPDFLPEKKEYVRISTIESFWKLTPIGDGNIEVVFRGYADPGGIIPDWLFRQLSKRILKKSPHKTLKQLKQIIKQKKYHKMEFPFIREPSGNREQDETVTQRRKGKEEKR